MSIRFYEMIGLWIFLDHPFFPYLDERVVCTCARCVRMYTCTYIYTYILTRLSKVSRLLRFFLFPMFRICRQSREKKVSIENSIYRLVLSSNVITRMISSLISSKNEKPFLPFLYYFIIIFLLLLLLSLFFYYYCYYFVSRKAWRLGGSLHIHRFATISLEGWCSGVL